MAAFTRRIRFPGRERILRRLYPPEQFRVAHEDIEVITDYDGNLQFNCDLGSWIEWNVFFKGFYDPDMSRVIKRLIRKGMVALDIGANVGAYSLIMANKAGQTGRIIAFEPNQEAADRLRENVAANSLGEIVKVVDIALSHCSGSAMLHTPPSGYFHRGISSLELYAEPLRESEEVRIETLDNILPSLGIHRADFVKIDTEGLDAAVIQGGKNLIAEHRPILIFECNYLATKNHDSIREAQSFLRNSGYRFFTVAWFGRLTPVAASDLLPDTDIVCLPTV